MSEPFVCENDGWPPVMTCPDCRLHFCGECAKEHAHDDDTDPLLT